MGVSIWQLLIVLVILLLLFGPGRIEGIGKSLGKSIKGFKKGMEEADDVDADQPSNVVSSKKLEDASVEKKDTDGKNNTD